MKNRIWYNYLGLALLSFAINCGFTFQLSNLTVLLKFAGATDSLLPLFWLIPPLTGLIVQPMIGYLSDESSTIYGKRKPYIIIWGICAVFSFLILPFYDSLVLILLSTFIIDCSLNGTSEGLRAITADLFSNSCQRTKAFAIFAFFAGLGGFLGAYLPNLTNMLLISKHHFSTYFILPINLICAYLAAGVMLALVILFCIKYIKEAPNNSQKLTLPVFFILLKKFFHNTKQLSQLKNSHPLFLKVLFIHSLSWLALFIFWLYFSVCLAQDVYHLPTNISSDNANYKGIMYNVSLLTSHYFSIYQYVSLLFTMVVFTLSRYIKIEILHGLALLCGSLGFCFIGLLAKINLLLLASVLIGIMWGSMTVLPYIIVLNILPQDKIGFYLGVFNMSVTLPQIMGGLLLPFIYTSIFQYHANCILLLAALLVLSSGILWLRLFCLSQPTIEKNSTDMPTTVELSSN